MTEPSATSDPVRVVFLAGIGRSGTTLVERTLAGVDGVTGLGEVLHLWQRGLVWHERCGCGRPFLECPFWSEVGSIAFGGWEQVDTGRMAQLKDRVDRIRALPRLARPAPSGGFLREADEYVDAFVRLYRAAHQVTGDVLVDSSKQASLAWLLHRRPDVDLRVVHCVRDSRGVAHSWSTVRERPEAVDPDHREMTRYPAPRLAAYWLSHNLATEALARRVPALRLRYEDFVAEPATWTRRMLDLAGVDAPVTHVHADGIDLSPGHSCAGNPMRFGAGRVDVVRDERWRSAQPPRQRRLVTGLTAPLLWRYGYLR